MALSQLISAATLLVASKIFYDFIFGSLRSFPGPLPAKFTDLWRAAATARGDIDSTHRAWHKQYGPAVRMGPNTISLSDPELIKTVYATKNAWQKVRFFVTLRGQKCC